MPVATDYSTRISHYVPAHSYGRGDTGDGCGSDGGGDSGSGGDGCKGLVP